MKYIKSRIDFVHEKKSNNLNEGQFSWMTQDSNKQIGSEKQNTIDVYMYDNEGNKWKETKYDGYGVFGGMDFYDLVATMNGYDADREKGIDLAFGKLKTKDKKRKTLFPALVEDPRYNWKRHNFTEQPENDPNQSWYQEEEDYDDYDESVVTEAKNDGNLDTIADYVKQVLDDGKSFMDIGKKLKGAYKYDFSTGMMPMYIIPVSGNKIVIINKKYVEKGQADRIVGDIAIGLMESMITESKGWNDVARVMDSGLKKAIKKGITDLRYAQDYVKSLERMAKKNAKQFFNDYGDFTEDDFIEDVRYNMANEKVTEAKEMSKKEVRDLKIKINNARSIGKYFTKDEVEFLQSLFESVNEAKGDKAVSMAQRNLDKVITDLKANLLKFKGAKTDSDKEKFKSEAKRLTKLRKDAQDNLEDAISNAYAEVELVVMENYDTDQRKEMASKGLALPDGSFPIKTLEDLKNAIQAYGRAKDQAKAAKFIAKRAKALGADDLIPDTEDFQKALKEASFGRIPKFGE
jgi:hypothetical protein